MTATPVTPEIPPPAPAGPARYGSDAIAETLRALALPFIALTPGASFRGLHDSLVNHLGNQRPQMLLCLHEETAVSLAQGWAKVTGRPLAVALHSNVGLLHGSMAIFNAWCDRVPMLIIGATGPVDAARRRPWIDWIHTAQDQNALVRGFVKWDAQPASVPAAQEALLRAAWLTATPPCAPVFVTLDAALQEAALDEPVSAPDPARFLPAAAPHAAPEAIAACARMLRAARRPVILIGRNGRDPAAWAARVALAEALGARVATDIKCGASFPTDHPLHLGAPATFPGPELLEALREADLVLSLDWVALAGALAGAPVPAAARVIQISPDHGLHNGWSMDHQGFPLVDLHLPAPPDAVLPALLAALDITPARFAATALPPVAPVGGTLSVSGLAQGLRAATAGRDVSLLHLPLGWNGADWPFRHPLDYLGGDGGAGIGAGPGIAVGAALALLGSGRLAVAVLGDGDYLMGVTALWTAAHYAIPLLVVIANNRSYYNDELHQERVARMRNRPVENKWIGQRLTGPEVDLAAMARAQGALGLGPVADGAALAAALAAAIAHVAAGGVAAIDVHVAPGYAPAAAQTEARRGAD